ncbi:MAG: NAD(P)-binding domain-containing protein [Myxococcaceae bacterium]|nr:NAD(P)-binding domain-containing protein [Myxococcaceae bacterium]
MRAIFVGAADSDRATIRREAFIRPPFYRGGRPLNNVSRGQVGGRREEVMQIGIIGAGHIGGTLTRRLTALGHEVRVANSRGPHTLQALARETGATPVDVREVGRDADIVIVAIPERCIPTLPPGVLDSAPPDAAIVDTGNFYPRQRDGRIEEIEAGMPESRWVEKHLGRPVIKAFNNMFADHLLRRGKPRGTPGRIALPIAGDDPAAKAKVMKLVDELGFDPVDAGGLDESWRQQPGTPVYATDLDVEGVRRALAAARPERRPEFRAESPEEGIPAPS